MRRLLAPILLFALAACANQAGAPPRNLPDEPNASLDVILGDTPAPDPDGPGFIQPGNSVPEPPEPPEPPTIPGTTILDTPDNRRVLDFCARYYDAFERLDAPAILAMAARDYRDDAGTPRNPSDDFDFAGLRARLPLLFTRISDVRIDTTFTELTELDGIIAVGVRRTGRFTVDGRVVQTNDENILRVRVTADGFEFVSGL